MILTMKNPIIWMSILVINNVWRLRFLQIFQPWGALAVNLSRNRHFQDLLPFIDLMIHLAHNAWVGA